MIDEDATVIPHESTLGPPVRRRGPAPRLTREQIADAVLELGFEVLTVAAVAEHLAVSPGGLYRYVADRDDLVVAAVDRAFATVPLSDAGDWRALLRDEAWARWDAVTAHPGLVRALRATGRPAPETRRRYAWCVHALVALGLSPEDALLAADSVVDLVNDGSQQFEALARVAAGGEIDEFVERQVVELGPDYRPVMRAVVDDPKAFFGRKVEILLAGLTAEVDPPA